jgi:hypothetical protein
MSIDIDETVSIRTLPLHQTNADEWSNVVIVEIVVKDSNSYILSITNSLFANSIWRVISYVACRKIV